MLDRLREASGGLGSILCEFGKGAIDEIMEIAEGHPEHLSMIKSLTSQAFEIVETIKEEKSGELAFNGVYYLDSMFPESCKGDDDELDDLDSASPASTKSVDQELIKQIDGWLFIQSICGTCFLEPEEVQLTIIKSGTRRTRRVLEYLRKLKEMCYNN